MTQSEPSTNGDIPLGTEHADIRKFRDALSVTARRKLTIDQHVQGLIIAAITAGNYTIQQLADRASAHIEHYTAENASQLIRYRLGRDAGRDTSGERDD